LPIQKRWSRFTLPNVRRVPDEPGAYELANKDGRIIDTGGSDVSVRDRLIRHLQTNKYPTARYFRYDIAGFFESGIDVEASHSKKFQRKHGRKPRYTERSPRVGGLFGFLK